LDHPKARQQTFNICMDEPVDYREMANYLNATRGMQSVEVKTPYRSTWLDNTKAKLLLGWRPRVNLPLLIENAWTFQRAETDPRNVWYLG
jgi:UDP-glucose 4-epimerase